MREATGSWLSRTAPKEQPKPPPPFHLPPCTRNAEVRRFNVATRRRTVFLLRFVTGISDGVRGFLKSVEPGRKERATRVETTRNPTSKPPNTLTTVSTRPARQASRPAQPTSSLPKLVESIRERSERLSRLNQLRGGMGSTRPRLREDPPFDPRNFPPNFPLGLPPWEVKWEVAGSRLRPRPPAFRGRT